MGQEYHDPIRGVLAARRDNRGTAGHWCASHRVRTERCGQGAFLIVALGLYLALEAPKMRSGEHPTQAKPVMAEHLLQAPVHPSGGCPCM